MKTDLEHLADVFDQYNSHLTPNMGTLQGIIRRAVKEQREAAEAEAKAVERDLNHVLNDESPGGNST